MYMQFGLDFGGPGFVWETSVVTPNRTPQIPKILPCSVETVDESGVLQMPSLALDGVLRSLPEFNTAGRAAGVSAHFYDQGVMVRGVGSDGAGLRVLLDGVPVNDPFGGWVAWAEVPREGLYGAEVIPCGGATAWGNGASGGIVQFLTLPPRGRIETVLDTPDDGGPPDPNLTKEVIRSTTQVATAMGDHDTRSAEFVSSQPTDAGVLQVLGRDFTTDGYPVVAARDRGPIDCPAWNRNDFFQARWRQPLGENVELTATLRTFHESISEGAPEQQDHLRGDLISIAVAGVPSTSFSWNGVVYVQQSSSERVFTAVDETRSAETPLIDEFAIPATALGASWTGAWRYADWSRTFAGIDLNLTHGEARENLAFSNAAFTRELLAGGDQGTLGAYISHTILIASTLHATIGARVDVWEDSNGHRREFDHMTWAVVDNVESSSSSGAGISPSSGIVWEPTEKTRLFANAQQSIRRPTLGERYETYGQGFVVTEPNQSLPTEHITSMEVGAEDRPMTTVTLGATAFSNELRDAPGKQTIAQGTLDSPTVGELPSGYFVQQRVNLDRVRVQGLKLSVSWQPSSSFSLDGNLIFNDPIILRCSAATQLEGRQMAQVSRRTAVLSARWQASRNLSFRFRVRSMGRQFVDDENALRLGDAVIADIGANYAVTEHAELYLMAENLTDVTVETGRSTNGVVCIGAPRVILGGLRWKW
jgi:outer membrane receptor protein involved in Fe transport